MSTLEGAMKIERVETAYYRLPLDTAPSIRRS
jgi:hypothetical protein